MLHLVNRSMLVMSSELILSAAICPICSTPIQQHFLFIVGHAKPLTPDGLFGISSKTCLLHSTLRWIFPFTLLCHTFRGLLSLQCWKTMALTHSGCICVVFLLFSAIMAATVSHHLDPTADKMHMAWKLTLETTIWSVFKPFFVIWQAIYWIIMSQVQACRVYYKFKRGKQLVVSKKKRSRKRKSYTTCLCLTYGSMGYGMLPKKSQFSAICFGAALIDVG